MEKNQEKYLQKFRMIINGKRVFNGAAAFFCAEWFAYRLLWLEGILMWVISSVILLIAIFVICGMMIGAYIGKESANMIFVLLIIARFIAVGMLADAVYWRKIKKRIDADHNEDIHKKSKIKQLANSIECKGVSVWSAVIMWMLLGFGNVMLKMLGALATSLSFSVFI
uniref:DUF2628 domain-containing protein n=1 Tax=Clostridium sp. NkU-1 TaxID=1095009 RepID=UPI00326132EA